MILNWTSSINNDCESSDSSVTYEDLMSNKIRNLVLQLWESDWKILSKCTWNNTTSEYSVDSYPAGQSYSVANENALGVFKFPDSMTGSNTNLASMREDETDVYDPSEHPWVTLTKYDTAKNKHVYLTIDCRYPLPPHVENSSLIIQDLNNPESIDNTTLYVGATAINTNLVTQKLKPVRFISDKQDLDVFKGICVRDENSGSISFQENSIQAQTNNSRAVAFVDIVMSTRVPSFTSDVAEGFITATTRVRPKVSKEDSESIYYCWGFDAMRPNKVITHTIPADDIPRYKYHFHKAPQTVAFMYQLSSRDLKEGFDSVFGILPIHNSIETDPCPFTIVAINVDPSYHKKSACVNSFGGQFINVIKNTTSISNSEFEGKAKSSLNTFYNTCFRNYNFSDGIRSRRYGDLDSFRKPANLPVFAPLKPSDSTLYCDQRVGVTAIDRDPTTEPKNSISASYLMFQGDTSMNNTFALLEAEYASKVNTFQFISSDIDSVYNKEIVARQLPDMQVFRWLARTVPTNNKDYFYFNNSDVFGAPLTGQDFLPAYFLKKSSTFLKASRTNPTPKLSFTLSLVPFKFLNDFEKEEYYVKYETPDDIDNTKYMGDTSRIFYNDFFRHKSSISQPAQTLPNLETYSKEYDLSLFYNGDKLLPILPSINGVTGAEQNLYIYIGRFKTWKLTEPQTFTVFGITPPTDHFNTTIPPGVGISGNLSIKSQTVYEYLSDFYQERDIYIKVKISDLYWPVINPDGYSSVYNSNANWGSGGAFSSGFKNVVSSSVSIDLNSTPLPSFGTSQNNGTNAFPVFKSSIGSKEIPLVAAKYNFAVADVSGSITDSNLDVFETRISPSATLDPDNARQIISMGQLRNTIDNSYSELPVFVLSADETNPTMKGYVTDLYWAPQSICQGSLVASPDGSAKKYQKIFWKGWWMPWVADDPADW